MAEVLKWISLRTKDGDVDQYAIGTECGRYSVAKICAGGRDQFDTYCGKTWLDTKPTADEAKAVAAADVIAPRQHETNDGV